MDSGKTGYCAENRKDTEALDEKEQEELIKSIEDIVTDKPNSECAASGYKKLIKKGGVEVGGFLRDLLVDVTGETIKKIIWP